MTSTTTKALQNAMCHLHIGTLLNKGGEKWVQFWHLRLLTRTRGQKLHFELGTCSWAHLLMTMPFDMNQPVYSANHKKLFTEISPPKKWLLLLICGCHYCSHGSSCTWLFGVRVADAAAGTNIARTNAYNFVFPFFLHLKT